MIWRKSKTTDRIKTQNRPHAWDIVGGHDPVLDGEHPRYAVRCRRCGERRRVAASFDVFRNAIAYGCARNGFTGQFKEGDQVIVGERLDYFVNYVPGGKAATTNAGGGTYVVDVADLQPDVPEAS